MAAPNAELAWKVLDHIDANPEQWDQDEWGCGTAACFAGWAVRLSGGIIQGLGNSDAEVVDGNPDLIGMHTQEAAYSVLGLTTFTTDTAEIDGKSRWLFHGENTREDLGRLVADIFGPRPGGAA